MNALVSFDLSLFRWINQAWSSPLGDHLFIFFTDLKNFIAVLGVFALWMILRGGARGRLLLISLILGVALTDQISSHVIKPIVDRVRPCNALEDVRTPYGKLFAPSFPSSHAANVAGVAMLLGLCYRRWGWAFALLALLVGLSRVYLGLHYPSDVLGGFALGALIGTGVWWFYLRAVEHWQRSHFRKKKRSR